MTHDEIAKLNTAERLSLISELWDSIADLDAPLPSTQREELLRRVGAFEDDRRSATTWDAIKADLATRRQ